jgi:beta-glucosidase
MTDWTATIDRVKGLKNGNDLEMPSSSGMWSKKILEAIATHQLDESILDNSVARILELIAKSLPALQQNYQYDKDAHHSLAKDIACQSIVLLKNSNNILPLKSSQKIAIIGESAMLPKFQGEGSSYVTPHKLENLCDCLKQYGANFVYAQGYEKDIEKTKDPKILLDEALEVSKSAEVILLFIGLTEDVESECFDRTSLSLPPEHNNLVESVSKINSNIIIILFGGSSIGLPWYDQVKGIIHSHLSGQAGAGAIVDIIFGKVNPSGKLTETYPLNLSDTPCAENFPGNPLTSEYRESIFVGYRYYDKMKKVVRFPFGFGLSYTKFDYSNLKLDKTQMKDNESLTLTFDLKNVGLVAGAEITQIYVSDIESIIFRPEKELKGFAKVFLQPNEVKNVSINLDKRAFAFYN